MTQLKVYPPDRDGVRHGLDVVLAGSYDVPGLEFPAPPRILDLGAHVGSFSVWAASRWPGAKILAFEPHPDNASYCRQNTEHLGVEVRQAAVVGRDKPAQMVLHDGMNNTGQRSVYQLGEQKGGGVTVPTVPAHSLPEADILKADTEGCEMEILREYPHLSGVKVVMLEWHRQEDYKELLRWLPELGFDLVRDDARGQWVADRNLIFVRRSAAAVAQPSSAAPTPAPVAADGPVTFQCPRSSLDMIAGLYGEYNLHSLAALTTPRVVDVGGHVGGFAWYALKRWPDAHVTSFEPHPETCALLRNNVRGMPVEVHNCAVVHPRQAPTMRLYEGLSGRHECSLRDDVRWPHLSQKLDQWVDVATFDAAELPPADVLKVDTEGSEIEILSGYRHLKGVRVLLVEAHAVGGDFQGQVSEDRPIARAAGLRQLGGHVLRFQR